MSVFNSIPPRIDQNLLILWLKENYSFLNKKSISLKPLNSERDKNYLISIDFKKKYVLKISNSEESKELLDLQDYILSKLSKRSSLRNFIPKKIHSSIKTFLDVNNTWTIPTDIWTYIHTKIQKKSVTELVAFCLTLSNINIICL